MDIQLPLIQFDEAKSKQVSISLDALPPNEDLLSPAPARDFVQDIASRGQIDPIKVTKAKGVYFVISGRRRIKAFRLLKEADPDNTRYQTIRALVYEVPDGDAILAASAENNRRSDNVLTDLQAIDWLQKQRPNISVAEIAALAGMSQGTVKRRLKLKKLRPELLQAFIDGKMTTATAEKAASLPDKFQSKLMIQLANEKKLTLEDVADAQRVRVQETVNTQLTIPEMEMKLDLAEGEPVVTQLDVTGKNPNFIGFAAFSVENNMVMSMPNTDRAAAQADLEAYQSQVEDPSNFVLVIVYKA